MITIQLDQFETNKLIHMLEYSADMYTVTKEDTKPEVVKLMAYLTSNIKNQIKGQSNEPGTTSPINL